jgi:hypothetical protein
MPEIGSLEHSSFMSEDTQDSYEPQAAENPNEAQISELASSEASETGETILAEPEATAPEAALPPEAQGEANGGPLGCCLGVMIGMLLSISVALLSRLASGPLGQLFQSNYSLVGVLTRILMGILVFVLAIVCGRIGWKLGKRFYREYEPPTPRQSKRRKAKSRA